METFILDLVHSSFQHLSYSYNFHIVTIYKYEVSNYFVSFIFYSLNNQLSSLQMRQNSMAYLNKYSLLNTKKPQQMWHSIIKSKFFV
jgi:hypothetical protein